MAILLFDDSRRAPRSAVGDAVYGDDVVLSPLPRHYQKSQKKSRCRHNDVDYSLRHFVDIYLHIICM